MKFPGFVGGEDKVRLLQESRLLAYTSPKEGWGRFEIDRVLFFAGDRRELEALFLEE